MKDLIKEVALEVADRMFKEGNLAGHNLEEFATAFLAELSKRAEAVGHVIIAKYRGPGCADEVQEVAFNCLLGEGTKLFTFPPIHDIEAIENRVAEACAKAAESDSEPAMNWCSSAIPGKFIANELRSGEWRKYK